MVPVPHSLSFSSQLLTAVLDDFLSGSLNSYCGTVSAWMGIHTTYNSSNGGLFSVTSRRVCDICAQEDHWLLEHRRSLMRYKNIIDSSKFNIDL